MNRPLLIGLAVLMTPILTTQAQEAVVLAPEVVDQGVAISEVAHDLAFPMGMTPLPDGSLLVATSPSASGDFYDSTGELVRLADSNADGSLDERTALASELPGSLVAVARSGEIVIATSAQNGNEQIMFFRKGETWSDALMPIEAIRFNFQGAMHQSYALATRPSPVSDGAFDLIFNIGAGGNNTDGPNVRFDGIISGRLAPSSLYLMTVTDHGSGVDFGEPVQIAAGLRNASALAFHPETGDLWIGENGIDGLEVPIEAFSADELDVIPVDEIGESVVDFGFPDSYVDYATGDVLGNDTAAVTFLPIDGSQAEGIAGIVFVPSSFPNEFAGGILAGFHGQFDQTGIANEENPVRWINTATGDQFDLISNDSASLGHLDSMTATDEAIYIADFCNQSMTNSQACGVIYRLGVGTPERND